MWFLDWRLNDYLQFYAWQGFRHACHCVALPHCAPWGCVDRALPTQTNRSGEGENMVQIYIS
jgi:hypothetical protein